jgi:hypothetical protein
MRTRIGLAAILIALSGASATAQSSTLSGTTPPTNPAPASKNRLPDTQKTKIRPAARSGESGLRVGEGAATGEPIEVKRLK